MATPCVSIAHPISSTISYDVVHRLIMFPDSTKTLCSFPNPRNRLLTQSLQLGRPLSCLRQFKQRSNVKKIEFEEDDDESKAVETVLKLYTDIKNNNIDGIAEVIGDDCNCFCNFSSTSRLLQGKKQVLAFFYWLMKMLGKNLKLVVEPTSNNGLAVYVHWRLEWEKPNIALGKGFSFHICHVYRGKLLIKNLEIFMEPIFNMGSLRLKTIAFIVWLAEKMSTYMRPGENTRKQAMTLLLVSLLLLAVAAVYITRPRFC